ncbi:MAG: TfuA-like protein [Xenococcaceae cyanobacterium MO_167.B52]|nr:TfuA-like protein [Xenococcaceae cyanobacterium MO_167.B52]
MPTHSNLILYGGPTLALLSQPKLLQDFKILPPIKRGDLTLLCQSEQLGTIVIVDGIFHNYLSVSHLEIREAISKGWIVWGGCSIGAIRAFEMKELGMRGFGKIFNLYCQEEDFQDDEVALLHEPVPPYRMFSEPLVHIRVAIQELQTLGLLQPDSGERIIKNLKNLWFGDRTLVLFKQQLTKFVSKNDLIQIKEILKDFNRFRLKTKDLEQFLESFESK